MTGEQVERRLAAILAADVAGFSALMERDEEGTYARIGSLRREVIEPCLSEHHGRLIKTTGDGFLAEFASPIAALRCALAIQNSQSDDPNALRLRIGLNLGDVIIEEGGDVYGEGVNVAARLEGLADPGGILISGKIHSEVEGKVTADFEDRGEQQVKNITRPVRIYAVRSAIPSIGSVTTIAAIDNLGLPALPDKPSIAVLPFHNMSDDSEQEYFADGMVEDIITALSRFKSLFVIARNSSFTYKGRAVDIKLVGRELGVRYVLEGSVRKAGSRVRITGQLIEAATGTHLWADKFNGELADVFDLQDRVTSSVVGVIEPKIQQIEIQRVLRKPTNDLEAYDYYLRGLAAWDRWTRDGNEEALRMFSRAVELDPNYAEASAWTAACYVQRAMQQWIVHPDREASEAIRLAKRGLEVGRDDATVLTGAAITLLMFSGDVEAAVALADRAIQINPNLSRGWSNSSWIRVFSGHPQLAIEHAMKAMQLDPLSSFRFQTTTPLALSYFLVGRDAEALIWAERALADNPNQLPTLRFVAAIKASNGQREAAQQIVKDILALNSSDRNSKIPVVRFLRRSDYRQKIVDALRLAGLPE